MTNFVRSVAAATVGALVFFTFSILAFGQAQTGTLRGTVTDQNGSVVAGASVTAKSQATNVAGATIQTNGEGMYVIPNLTPGKYTLTVEMTGFKKKSVTDVDVGLGAIADVPVALEVGTPSETVTVTSTGEELVTKDQAQISTTFETRKIEELPSNGAGGGLDTLALLSPGVVASRNSGVNTDGVGLSVNGNRGRSNNFQIDGSDNNDLSIGGPSLFVDNQSQVSEIQVITNNFSAQYGRNSGAVVNYITKSGGNEFHGDLFEYHQNWAHLSSLNNRERASGKLQPAQNIYNAFGGTVGGPIWLPKFGEGGKSIWKGKDRAFFFFTYQGVRNPFSFTARGTTLSILGPDLARLGASFPTNSAIQDIATLSAFAATNVGSVHPRTDQGTGVPTKFFFGALPAGCTTRALAVSATPPAGCSSVAYTTFINPVTGAPYLTSGPFDVFNLGTSAAPNLFQAAFAERDISEPYTENEWSYRITVRATDKDNVDFRHIKQTQIFANNGAASNGFTYDVPATSKNLGGTWSRQISNSLVNEVKITTQDLDVEFGGANSAYGVFAIPKPADIGNAIANITFGGGLTGVTRGIALSTIGPPTNIPQGRLVKVYQYADTVTWTKGRHSLVLGAEYKHLVNKVPFLPLFNGQFTFSTSSAVTRLLNNAPSAISLTAGDPVTTYKENDQYYFIQDDFKLRPNLTLNLGLRYEYTGQPINALHDITVARETGSKPFFDTSLPLDIRTVPKIPADKNNWAPRVGFAWSPKYEHGFMHTLVGSDATVIRGGFAIAYDPAFYNILLNVQNVAPYSAAIALTTANALSSTATSPLPLPGNPTGNNIQAIASASGVLPLGKLNPLFLSQTKVSSDFHSPYSEQFSFGIQRQLNRRNVFEVSYVGTHGVSLFQSINDNFFIGPLVNGLNFGNIGGQGPYTFPSFASLLPPGTTAQVCTDNLATPFVNESVCNGRLKRQAGITTRANTAQSIYHSMQARYAGRFLNNALSLNASYTFSKTIDNASEIFAFADIGSANAQNPFCINKCERALSNLDRRHAFSLSFLYDLPFQKEQHGLVGHLLGGWQVNGVHVATSGNPYTPFEGINPNFYGLGNTYLTSGDRAFIGNPKAPATSVAISALDAFLIFGAPQVAPNSTLFYSMTVHGQTGQWVPVNLNDVRLIINAPGSAKILGTPFGDMPRNYLHGPILNQLNMSLFKNTKIGERVKLQLQASAFNVLNHPNPGYGVNTVTGNYIPNITLENAGVPGSGFAEFKDITYARRVVQFGLRLIF
jgi:hypothetical protein